MGDARVRGFRHVLCPVDFSRQSRAALRYAGEIARRQHARLTVLVVNDPLLASAAAAAAYDTTKLTAATNLELAQFVNRTLGSLDPPAFFAMALGHPAPEIQKAVKRLGADLIVMGTHGLSGAGKWFFGSTTEQVLREISVPVLAVPARSRRSRSTTAMGTWPGRTVLAPIDLDRHAAADARAAAQAAARFGAHVRLLHVVETSPVPPWLSGLTRAHERRRWEAARTRLNALARLVGRGADCELLVGKPVVQIAARASASNVGLIILTLRPSGAALRQGTLTYRLLCAQAAPVLALPARTR